MCCNNNFISFLAKLEAEKPPIANSNVFKINIPKKWFVQNLDTDNPSFLLEEYSNSKEFENLIEHLLSYLGFRVKHIKNYIKGGDFWLAYEYEKPKLWSIIEINTVILILEHLIVPSHIEDERVLPIIHHMLFNVLAEKLILRLPKEKISFDLALLNGQYVSLSTGKPVDSDSNFIVENNLTVVLKKQNTGEYLDLLVVLDLNNEIHLFKQIDYFLKKIRNQD